MRHLLFQSPRQHGKALLHLCWPTLYSHTCRSLLRTALPERVNFVVQEQAKQNAGLAPQDQTQEQEAKAQIDARSVYVGNVDYAVTPEELQQHFQVCYNLADLC